MRRPRIEPAQESTSRGRHNRRLIIRAGKRTHGRERREPHDGDELDLLPMIPPQKINGHESVDRARENSLEDLRPEEALVGIRVFGIRLPMPNTRDHKVG